MSASHIGSVIWVACIVLLSAGRTFSQPQTSDLQPRWRTIARWFGSFDNNCEKYATREPGLFGMALSSPHYRQSESGTIVLREEVDDVLGLSRTVVESLSWSSNVSDLYYVESDGGRVPCGEGGSASRSFGEGQLAGTFAAVPQRLEQARRALEQARANVDRAKQEKEQAEQALRSAPQQRAPTTQAEADMHQAMSDLQAINGDPSATEQARQAALARFQQASQRYNDWITHKTRQFQEKYVTPMQELQKLLDDDKSSEAQKEQALRQLQMLSAQMGEESKSIFSGADPASEARNRVQAAQAALDSARQQLLHAARDLYWAQQPPDPPVSASAGVSQVDGRLWAEASFRVNHEQLSSFTVQYQGLTIRQNVNGQRMAVVLDEAKPHQFKIDASIFGQTAADENGAATISAQEQGGGGQDGLVGGSRYSRSFTITRLPVKQQLLIRGRLFYRIRMPADENDDNLIMRDGVPISLAGAIPVAGVVRVEGRLMEPQAARLIGPQPLTPPINVADARNGIFELAMPLQPGKLVRLSFIHHSSQAQLTETITVDVSTDSILGAWEGLGQGDSAPVEQAGRSAECLARWENQPRPYWLGAETRGATVRREGDLHILQFEGFNSILINTFVFKAPYLNQNRHRMRITARVPAARLLAARPAFVPEADVRRRLRIPPTGPAPEWTEAEVEVKGTVACFPTSVTMSLAGLGLVDIPEDAGQSEQIQQLAQAIYEWYSTNSANGPFGRTMPEAVPFPLSPAMIDALERPATTQPVVVALRNQMLQVLRSRYNYWPFVEGDEETMKWLISVKNVRTIWRWSGEQIQAAEENMRPWQWAWIVGKFVEQTYGTKVAWYTQDQHYQTGMSPRTAGLAAWANVFSIQPQKLFQVLGRGCGSITSIRHRTESGEGGHLIALVGAVINTSGNVVRLIFHDPYGDQSRNPTIEGYYHLGRPNVQDRSKFDRDPQNPADLPGGDSWGKYAPYGPEINSYKGSMGGKWWEIFYPVHSMTPQTMTQQRMLASVPPP